MDEQNGDTEEDEMIGEGIGESEIEEWGWRRDKGSWFYRDTEAYRKKRSVILRENDVRGRARVKTDKERVLRGHWRKQRRTIAQGVWFTDATDISEIPTWVTPKGHQIQMEYTKVQIGDFRPNLTISRKRCKIGT